MRKLFEPFERISRRSFLILVAVQAILTVLTWHFASDGLVPKPGKVAAAFGALITSRILLDNVLVSLLLTLKAMAYAIVITLLFTYLSVLPFFNSIAQFLVKCRYLTL